MTDRAEASGGFSVLDGAAMVAGAAVAAVHLRRAIDIEPEFGLALFLTWGTFAWIALTAAGPFVYLVRKRLRGMAGYPQVGDRLWTMLGIPWLLTALIQSGGKAGGDHHHDLLALVLGVSLAGVCLVSLGVVWATWVMVAPSKAASNFSGPWTNRVGLVLAVAWPIQCGVGMVVIG